MDSDYACEFDGDCGAPGEIELPDGTRLCVQHDEETRTVVTDRETMDQLVNGKGN